MINEKRRKQALKDQTKVSIATTHRIRELTNLLKAEFGSDYAFTIMGHGHVVAASNMELGEIEPVSRESFAHQFQAERRTDRDPTSVHIKFIP